MRPMQVVAFWESVNLEDPTSVLTPLGVSAFGCGQIMKAKHVSLLSAVVSGSGWSVGRMNQGMPPVCLDRGRMCAACVVDTLVNHLCMCPRCSSVRQSDPD